MIYVYVAMILFKANGLFTTETTVSSSVFTSAEKCLSFSELITRDLSEKGQVHVICKKSKVN